MNPGEDDDPVPEPDIVPDEYGPFLFKTLIHNGYIGTVMAVVARYDNAVGPHHDIITDDASSVYPCIDADSGAAAKGDLCGKDGVFLDVDLLSAAFEHEPSAKTP